MTAALVAGKKESTNKFTGIVAGELSNITDKNKSLYEGTGVFGFKDGAMVYALRDDGVATFGSSGSGQIILDGSSADIKSGNYDAENGKDSTKPTQGMWIDLDGGNIYASGFALTDDGLELRKVIDEHKNEVPSRTEIQYARNNDPDEIDIDKVSWSTTVPSPENNNKYIW
jgi:hypothetical protein